MCFPSLPLCTAQLCESLPWEGAPYLCDIWLGSILCLFWYCCIALCVLTFILSACLELCGCENPVPNSCTKNLLLWSAMATAGIVCKNWDAVHNPFPLKLCQMSGKLQKTVGVLWVWWLQLSPSLFLWKECVHGFLSCLDQEVGGSRSSGCQSCGCCLRNELDRKSVV